jgi:tetratricopeptide (TPR) repeat protein
MVLMARRQAEVLEELQEWREDVRERGIGSRVVLLAVPTGWGRSAVLAQFRDSVDEADGPVTMVAGIDGNLAGGRAVQAAALREVLAGIAPPSRAAELLDLDTPAGKATLGLEVGAWFVPGLAVAVSVTVLSRLLGAAGRVRDDGPAGEAGAVARAARAVAAVSVKVPVVVVIDDADLLDVGLARAVISGLAGRYDGRVLVVAAAGPESALVTGLVKDAGYDLAGRVRKVSADPGMGYAARVELARELLPGLPAQAAERIARRTATFGEVFAVAAADMVAGLGPGTGVGEAVAAADAVIGAVLDRAVPSREAAVLAWAGGALHERQADACLRVLGAERVEGDVHVRRAGPLACLADPVSPRCAEQAAAFSPRQRAGLAGAVLAAAGQVAADSGAGLADRVVARQAVHRVRADLDLALRDQLPQGQCALIRGLEKLGDHAAAWQVAREALAETPPGDAGRQDLLMACLRLARTRPAPGGRDPLVEEAISATLAAGAAIGLEARVWAAADLLGRDGDREQALALAGQVTDELETRAGLGEAGDQWRLLLAFAAGRAGRPDLAQRLLAPMLSSGTASREKAAQAVLRAVDGPHADIRLQIIVLQAELEATLGTAEDDQLRLHAALADSYDDLGIYPQALGHGRHELALRQRLQNPDHPGTLTTRNNIAAWTGECGDAAGALRLFTPLLPDQERVLGPDHPGTLTTRNNIAAWTGECGDAAGALRLATALLPDQERVLGPDHPGTLSTRGNIAFWTGECGDAAGALRLATALLPDRERVLGPDHPDTLTTRNNIAFLTGQCGDAAGALRLATALLPDQERVLGPDHPGTLTTQNNIAGWTGLCGDAAGALRLATALLPDQERVLGPDHPDTLSTRNNIAFWTGECGDAAGALRLFTALLPDRERVLGPDHPDTLTTRGNIAEWTAQIRHGSRNERDRAPLAELGRLADQAVAAGDTAAAVAHCEQMGAAAEEAFGPGDIRLTGYLRRAASILAEADRDAQAIEALKRAITINDRYGAETAEAVDDLRGLAGLQQRNGLHHEAQQNLDRARDIEARHSEATG